MWLNIVNSIGISLAIFFLIVFLLVIIPPIGSQDFTQKGLEFSEQKQRVDELVDLDSYVARDGTELSYRYYSAETKTILILLHGSGWHSRYLSRMGQYLSSNNLAQVYTPDLRGHGESPRRRGDIDYLGQFEDDIADLVSEIKTESPSVSILLAGHSSGGGLALRIAGGRYKESFDGYLLLAPFLKYNAPTTRPNSGGWAQPFTRRIIGLEILNSIGITAFNYLDVIRFNFPQHLRDGTETDTYTYQLNKSYAPLDYERDLQTIRKPLKVIVGASDEAFYAEQFAPVIEQFSQGDLVVIPEVGHLDIVENDEVLGEIKEWLESKELPR